MSNEVREGNSKQCSLHHHLHRLVFCFINLILHGGIKTTHFLNLGQVFGIFAGGQHGFQKGISAHDLVAVLKFLIIQIGEHGTSHGQLAKVKIIVGFLLILVLLAGNRNTLGTGLPKGFILGAGDGLDLPRNGVAILTLEAFRSNKLDVLNGNGVFSQKSGQAHCFFPPIF